MIVVVAIIATLMGWERAIVAAIRLDRVIASTIEGRWVVEMAI